MTKNVAKTRNVEVVIEDREVVPDRDPMIVRIVDRGLDRDHLRKSRKKRKKLGIVNVKNCGKKNRNANKDWPWRPN